MWQADAYRQTRAQTGTDKQADTDRRIQTASDIQTDRGRQVDFIYCNFYKKNAIVASQNKLNENKYSK